MATKLTQKQFQKLSEKEKAKFLLLEHVKPGNLLLFVVKRSRTGKYKRIKIYQVTNEIEVTKIQEWKPQQLLTLTVNVAVLMGLANSDSAKSKAFRDGLLTDDETEVFAHYLAVALFGPEVAKENPFIDEYIEM